MAELEPTPLSALLDPPLADPPPVSELEQRAERLRRRRWAGRGAGVAAVVALLAGAVALAQPGGEQTVRTAAPPPAGGGGNAASPVAESAPSVLLHEFEAGGRTWRLGVRDAGELCFEVRSDSEVAGGECWNAGTNLAATSVDAAGTTYLFGIAGETVRLVSHAGTPVPFVGTVPSGVGARAFAKIMPPDLASVELVGATETDPRAYTATVTLHGRVSVINGQVAPAAPPSTTAVTRGPTATVANPPTTVGPDTPVSTVVPSPTTTVAGPPPGGNPQRVQVTPGATSLRKHVFESAFATGASSVAVRFWDGVEPCSVVGRVDVAEAADKVTITLWTGTGPGAEAMSCIAMAVYKEVVVPLSAPLGGRTIVDGAA